MKLTTAQQTLVAHVNTVLSNVAAGNLPTVYMTNSVGGVAVQSNRNGAATARKLIELGVMVDATEPGSATLAIKPVANCQACGEPCADAGNLCDACDAQATEAMVERYEAEQAARADGQWSDAFALDRHLEKCGAFAWN